MKEENEMDERVRRLLKEEKKKENKMEVVKVAHTHTHTQIGEARIGWEEDSGAGSKGGMTSNKKDEYNEFHWAHEE